jgi:hypothetical protein
MRLIAVLAAMVALCRAATAQTGDCRLIADPSARLACYDKIAAAPAARSPARPQASSADSRKNVDGIGDEDAVVNAKLHGICRGC